MHARPYADGGDLRLMQDLVSEAWRLEGPLVERHIGDVAWSRFHIAGREHEWRIRLWEDDGRVVAWAWLYLPRTLDFQLHPRLARRGLAAAVCTLALVRLREHGARTAVVYARGDPAYPAPLRLYESIGFRAFTSSVTLRRAMVM